MSVFGKFGVRYFLVTPVLRYALLPFFRRIASIRDLQYSIFRSVQFSIPSLILHFFRIKYHHHSCNNPVFWGDALKFYQFYFPYWPTRTTIDLVASKVDNVLYQHALSYSSCSISYNMTNTSERGCINHQSCTLCVWSKLYDLWSLLCDYGLCTPYTVILNAPWVKNLLLRMNFETHWDLTQKFLVTNPG